MSLSYISMENKAYLNNIFCSIPCMPMHICIYSSVLLLIEKKKKDSLFAKHVPCIYIY